MTSLMYGKKTVSLHNSCFTFFTFYLFFVIRSSLFSCFLRQCDELEHVSAQ